MLHGKTWSPFVNWRCWCFFGCDWMTSLIKQNPGLSLLKACGLTIDVVWSSLSNNLSLSQGVCKSSLRLCRLLPMLTNSLKITFESFNYWIIKSWRCLENLNFYVTSNFVTKNFISQTLVSAYTLLEWSVRWILTIM